MTDRFKGFVVTLAEDLRSDDAQPTLDAIRMIKGVVSVLPSVVTPDDLINRERVRVELGNKLFEVLRKDE